MVSTLIPLQSISYFIDFLFRLWFSCLLSGSTNKFFEVLWTDRSVDNSFSGSSEIPFICCVSGNSLEVDWSDGVTNSFFGGSCSLTSSTTDFLEVVAFAVDGFLGFFFSDVSFKVLRITSALVFLLFPSSTNSALRISVRSDLLRVLGGSKPIPMFKSLFSAWNDYWF